MKSRGLAGCVVALIATLAVNSPVAAKELSDASVQKLMNYAWTLVPAKFTAGDKVIITDKKNRKAVMVPIDVAREVVRVGRLSAHAQICDLREAQVANFRTMMRLEKEKNKWTEQQMLFINQLHLFTVMWLNGQVQVVSQAEGKDPTIVDLGNKVKKTCDAAQKAKVMESIVKYVKAHQPDGPVPGPAAAAGAKAQPVAKK